MRKTTNLKFFSHLSPILKLHCLNCNLQSDANTDIRWVGYIIASWLNFEEHEYTSQFVDADRYWIEKVKLPGNTVPLNAMCFLCAQTLPPETTEVTTFPRLKLELT